jgi:molecular chaperone DnaK (HSP70)
MSADEETSSSGSPVVIGLSFGNAYSSIAFTSPSDGTAAVIANEEGDRQIPSILSYVSGEEFHGTQAKAQIIRNPRNTVAFFRDYLGKGFKDIDATPCHASAHPVEKNGVSFEVQEGEGDAKSTLSVSEVATRHLKRLKESASDYLGRPVTAAVVTVPSDFDDAQVCEALYTIYHETN